MALQKDTILTMASCFIYFLCLVVWKWKVFVFAFIWQRWRLQQRVWEAQEDACFTQRSETQEQVGEELSGRQVRCLSNMLVYDLKSVNNGIQVNQLQCYVILICPSVLWPYKRNLKNIIRIDTIIWMQFQSLSVEESLCYFLCVWSAFLNINSSYR